MLIYIIQCPDHTTNISNISEYYKAEKFVKTH